MKDISQSRREFVKKTSLIASSLAAIPFASKAEFYNTSADDSIKVALIGCGGRGTGAAMQAMLSKQNVKLVSMADAFRDRIDSCFKVLSDPNNEDGNVSDKVAVPEENKFTGFDGYKRAIALADVVILTTPPGFRPIHFEEAVNQKQTSFVGRTGADRR